MFFNVCLHSRAFQLRADWRKSDNSVDEEPKGDWRWNSNPRDVVASSPSFSHLAARAPWRDCSQARQNNSFVSNKYVPEHYIIRYKQQNWRVWKRVRLTSFQKPQLQSVFRQVCPSVPPFVFAGLFIPSFDVLSGYFCVSIIWWQSPTVKFWFLGKCQPTPPLARRKC